MSLRLRLVGALLVLAALGIGTTAAVGNDLLHSYLLRQTDRRLMAASASLSNTGMGPGIFGARDLLRLPNDLVFLVVDDDGQLITASPIQPDLGGHRPPRIDGITYERALELQGQAFTARSEGEGADWRAVAEPVTYQGGRGSVIIATSLGDVDRTLRHLQTVELLTGVAVLAGLALVGIAVVRISLRPLTDIEEVAEAIGAGDLARRVPEAPLHTEVGRLSAALNGMLSQIERAVQERTESERAARSSEEVMRRFVADASHELRTPLTSIRGFAELHRQKRATLAPGESERMLDRIESEATRMSALVEDLLTLARLDQRAPAAFEPVDLIPIATDAVYDAHVLAPDRPVHIELPSDATEVVTMGIEAQIREVLGNLVSNALSHTPQGVAVLVRVEGPSEANGFAAVIEVADEGPGMTSEQAAHVFERFYRVDPARSRASGGSGLGLAIAGAIVEAHGGRIELFTAPDQGARFRVVFPAGPQA